MNFSGDEQANQKNDDCADYLEAIGHQEGGYQLVDLCHLFDFFAQNAALIVVCGCYMNVFIICCLAIDSTECLRYPFCK